jgi:hypothetical protein
MWPFGNLGKHGLIIMTLPIFLLASVCLRGQPRQTGRYEKKLENGDKSYTHISLKEKGIALVRDKEKFTDGKKLWEVIVLDTALNELHSEEFDLESRLNLIGYEYVNNKLYLLFRKSETDINDFLLRCTKLENYSTTQYTIKQELNFKITHFSIAGGSAVFGGYVNREPAVILYELKADQTKIVPGFFLTDTELLDLRINHNNTFNTLLVDRGSRENKKLIVKTFDEWGSLLLEDAIKIPSDRTILTGMTSTLERDEMILVGTWATPKSTQASGIYSIMVDPFSDQDVRFYDFGELSHFFEYLKPKKAAKTFAKSNRSRVAGKIPDFKTSVNIVKVSEYPDGFSLLAEVYLQSSNLNSSPYWNNYSSPYGNPYAYNSYGFNPFSPRYYNSPYSNYSPSPNADVSMLHSSLTFFDLKGKLKNDYGFKLNNTKQPDLEQISDYVTDMNRVSIAFKSEGEINVKTWAGDSVVMDTLKIKLKTESEKVRQEYNQNTGVKEWYPHTFYIYGYESIREKEKSDDQGRYIFYINKLEIK